MIAAIDSGAEGAIAILEMNGRLVDIIDMPYVKTSMSFVDSVAIKDFISKYPVTEIAIEEVRGIRGKSTMQTVFRQGGSYFPLGHTCYMLGIEPYLYDPKKWKAAIGVSGTVNGSKKEKCFQLCCKLYPNQLDLFYTARKRKLDGRTDAIGIGLAHLKLRKK